MVYTVSLYLALTIFGIGLLIKFFSWFRYKIGDLSRDSAASGRLFAGVRGVFATIFSAGIITLVKSFFVDVVFQWRILKENPLRWVMHMLIYAGFMLLFFIHALGHNVSHPFFSTYYSTINPFLFLRDLFGLMVIGGVAIAIYRRITVRRMRLTTTAMDKYAIIILAVIIVSGVFLEAAKIVSYSRFNAMVEEYNPMDEGDQELKALKAYWQANYAVVFPTNIETTPELLEMGREVNENNCLECHSRPTSAFMSFGVAKAITPIARGLTAAGVATWLFYIHFLACFVGLAYLPFSKFFHIISTPVSLLANAVMNKREPLSANIATRRAMELDACMHCATCSTRCSVGVVYEMIPNANILPSEKLISLKALASGQSLSDQELQTIAEGSHICTSCYRCTSVCPAGINLQDLWFSIREELAQRSYPEPFILARDTITTRYNEKIKQAAAPIRPNGNELRAGLNLSVQAHTFSNCFECQTCTNVCPVVTNYENPKDQLGLLPHQIMHSLGLGLRDEALSSRMVWDCVTCYLCQENCPQGVQVADVLYELKNIGYQNLEGSGTASAQKADQVHGNLNISNENQNKYG